MKEGRGKKKKGGETERERVCSCGSTATQKRRGALQSVQQPTSTLSATNTVTAAYSGHQHTPTCVRGRTPFWLAGSLHFNRSLSVHREHPTLPCGLHSVVSPLDAALQPTLMLSTSARAAAAATDQDHILKRGLKKLIFISLKMRGSPDAKVQTIRRTACESLRRRGYRVGGPEQGVEISL